MALGGVAVFVPVQEAGRGSLNLNLSGVTLAINAGAFDPTGAAADSGLLNSNNGVIDAVPANTTSLPTDFGPGEDNWAADDVTALQVALNDTGAVASNLSWRASLVANVNPLPAGVNKTNANVVVGLHNRGAAATGLQARVTIPHTLTL
jgi:hypothetical protein